MMKAALHKIYDQVPFKYHIFSTLKRFWSPPKRVYQHLSFRDDFKVTVDEKRSFKMKHFGYELENELFWRGLSGWEAVSFDLWIRLCKDAEVIFDVGANTGVFALIAKTINPNAEVYAFEPVKRVAQKIDYNNSINNYDIKVIQKAAADYDGVGTIYDPMEEHLYSVTVNKNGNSPDRDVTAVEIETIKLSTFIEKEEIKKIDLMKIDVESFEPEVLEGLGPYLKKFQPPIIIEILGEDIGRRVDEIMKGLDYLYFKVENNRKLVRTEHIRNEIVREDDDHNYFFCPPAIAKKLNLL